MKPLDDDKRIQTHAFVCTNNRDDGRDACLAFGGQEFFAKMKQKVKDLGLKGTHKVTRTGCLSHCNNVGCTIVIYHNKSADKKNAQWFTEVTAADFDKIWEKFVSPE